MLAAPDLCPGKSPPDDAPAIADGFAQCDWYVWCKRTLEWTLSFVLLVLSSPLVAVAMLLVKLTSRGPVLYSQTRLGRAGKPFTLYKIRSMTCGAESLTGVCWSRPGDSRVTCIGRWLRRTHIDELPQLWNVLRGDMSLIGPRPERPEFVRQLGRAIPLYGRRLLVRPGITGLAQIQLPPDSDLESVRRKIAYDLYYVQHCSLWLDCRIAWATVLSMMGVPPRWIGAIFAFPSRQTVHDAYERQVAGRKSTRELRPASIPLERASHAFHE